MYRMNLKECLFLMLEYLRNGAIIVGDSHWCHTFRRTCLLEANKIYIYDIAPIIGPRYQGFNTTQSGIHTFEEYSTISWAAPNVPCDSFPTLFKRLVRQKTVLPEDNGMFTSAQMELLVPRNKALWRYRHSLVFTRWSRMLFWPQRKTSLLLLNQMDYIIMFRIRGRGDRMTTVCPSSSIAILSPVVRCSFETNRTIIFVCVGLPYHSFLTRFHSSMDVCIN